MTGNDPALSGLRPSEEGHMATATPPETAGSTSQKGQTVNAPPLGPDREPYLAAFDWATGEWAFSGPIHKIEDEFKDTQEAKDLMAALVAAQNAYYMALREFGWTKRKHLSCPNCGRLPEQKS